jgi:membrane protein implicated in regulation of membrane protease activity
VNTDLFSRILLTVLVAPAIAALAYWALAGMPWLALILFVAGTVLLWWIWKPVVARARQRSRASR